MKKIMLFTMLSLILSSGIVEAISPTTIYLLNQKKVEFLQFLSNLSVGTICLNGSCRSTWPVSSEGNGNVTELTQGTGIILTPNPITTTGTVEVNITWGDARWGVNLNPYQLKGVEPCPAGNAVTGLGDTLACNPFLTSFTETDQPAYNGTLALNSTFSSYYLASNPSSFWNNTYAAFNKTYADTLYSTRDSWTNDTNIGLSANTVKWLGTLADGRIASATTWNNKEPAIGTGTAGYFWAWDKTFKQVNTSVVTEGTNLYYLDSRARAAHSASSPILYNSGTGAFSLSALNSTNVGNLAGENITTGTVALARIPLIGTTQLVSGTLNQGNLTNTVAACTNQFSRGMGAATQNCASVGTNDISSGAITNIKVAASAINTTQIIGGSDQQVLKMSGTTVTWGTDATGVGGSGANVSTTTCSGTDKVSGINNATGVVTCSADQTGAGSGYSFRNYSRTTSEYSTSSNTVWTAMPQLTMTLASTGTSLIECELNTASIIATTGSQVNTTITGCSSQNMVGSYTATATGNAVCSGKLNPSNACLATGSGGVNILGLTFLNIYCPRSGAGTFSIAMKSEVSASMANVSIGSWCREMNY